jgi:ABC-type transporter Mla MlaB component
MFRISTFDTPQERRLVVEGTLMSPWVAELRKTWGTAGASLEGRRLVIDLTNATRVDAEGEAAIFELMQDGAKFSCSGVVMRHVLRQLAHKCNTRLNRVLKQKRSRQRVEETEEL